MRKGLIAVAAVAAALTLVGVASASTDQEYLYWSSTTNTDWMGVRSSISNPAGSQRAIGSPDFFISSVYATNGDTGTNARALQQGVLYINGERLDPNGNCTEGVSSPAMFYFEETDDHGSYTCYYEGGASTTDTHVQQVKKTSGNWFAYMDGNKITNYSSFNWTDCGGNACGLYAFGEEGSFACGLWQAKFSGSGNTDWQQYNGTLWSTIHNYSGPPISYGWTPNLNSFPDGLWTFTYSVCQ